MVHLMARTLIADGTVVTASDTFRADVWIDGERVVALTEPSQRAALGVADRTIDAAGRYVLPGGVDVHTHLELPFPGGFTSDDFATGTVAAAHGGTTTIIDFAIQDRARSLAASLDTWHAKAEPKVAIDYGLHMILTQADAATLDGMAAMVGEGVTSFKMFMAYPGVYLADEGRGPPRSHQPRRPARGPPGARAPAAACERRRAPPCRATVGATRARRAACATPPPARPARRHRHRRDRGRAARSARAASRRPPGAPRDRVAGSSSPPAAEATIVGSQSIPRRRGDDGLRAARRAKRRARR
jgi:hypothetical protein